MLFLLFLLLLKSFEIKSANITTINILHVNDIKNENAIFGFDIARNYYEYKNNLKINVKTINGSSSKENNFNSELCGVYDGMVEAGTPPDVILDTTQFGVISDIIQAFSAKLALPTLSSAVGQIGDIRQWRNITKNQAEYLLQILPPMDVIPEVIRDIIYLQNYSTAAILNDPFYPMEHKYKSLLQNLAVRHYISDIEIENSINQLIHIRKLKILNLFVVGSLKSIEIVLNGANAINMFTKEFSWHAITHNYDSLQCECKNANIIYINPIISTYLKKKFDYFSKFSNSLSTDMVISFYFDLSLNAFLTGRMIQEGKEMKDYLKCNEFMENNTPERAISVKNIIKKNADGIFPFNITYNGLSSLSFSMDVEVVKFVEGSIIKKDKLGTWSVGFNIAINYTDPAIMKSYSSITFYRISIIEQQPFLFADKNSRYGYSGYCIDLLEEIATILNFQFELTQTPDNRVGKRNPDGTWSGIMRDLLHRRADIGLGTISVTAERKNIVAFTVPFYDTVGHTILMKAIPPSKSIFRFLQVFEGTVWVGIVATYLFTALILWIFYKFSPFGYPKIILTHERRFGFLECLWFCLISLTAQGAGAAPTYLSGRLMTAAWWLFAFLMISSFSANLSAVLTVSRLETEIKSLDDLYNQYKIQYAPIKDSITMEYFEKMAGIEAELHKKWEMINFKENIVDFERAQLAIWENPMSTKYLKLWNNMKRAGLPETLQEAVKRVKDSKTLSDGFAFIGDATDIRYLSLTNCDLQIVGEEFHRKAYAIAVQYDSPLKNQLDNVILELINRGKMEALKKKWWDNNPLRLTECFMETTGTIDIENIAGIFIFLGVSITSLMFILIIDYFWKKKALKKIKAI